MPIIAWVVAFFNKVVFWIIGLFGFKAASVFVFISIMLSLTAAFTLLLNGIIAGIDYAMPNDPWLRFGMSLLPNNIKGLASAYAAAVVARYVYDQKRMYTYYIEKFWGSETIGRSQ